MHLFQTFVSNQQNDKNNFILYVIHKMRNPKYFVRKLKCESRAGYLVKFIRPVPPGKCLQNLRPRGASHRFKPKRSVLRARDVFFPRKARGRLISILPQVPAGLSLLDHRLLSNSVTSTVLVTRSQFYDKLLKDYRQFFRKSISY